MYLPENKPNQPFTVLFTFCTAISIMILLCGCPYHTAFPIEKTPQVEVNYSYLGFWKGRFIDEIKESDKFSYPVELDMIPEFEKLNDLKINIFKLKSNNKVKIFGVLIKQNLKF
jgi:hypothetical protein